MCRLVTFRQKLKSMKPNLSRKYLEIVKLCLMHSSFVLLTAVYIFVGAIAFRYLEEGPHRNSYEQARVITAEKQRLLLTELKRLAKMDRRQEAEIIMDKYAIDMFDLHKQVGSRFLDPAAQQLDAWSIKNAMFFGSTTLSTIGYGNQVPKTFYGRVFCIVFALIGLPLIVCTIADLAKFLSHFILWLYMKYLIFAHSDKCQENGAIQSFKRFSLLVADDAAFKNENYEDYKIAELLWENLEQAEIVRVPPTLMISLVLLYVLLGALIFGRIERWSFDESFYFSFISVFCIGLGDFTPQNESFLALATLYVLGGVLLATACIDSVGINYVNKLHNVGRRLKATDPLEWLKAMRQRHTTQAQKIAAKKAFNILIAPINTQNQGALASTSFKVESDDPLPPLSKQDMKAVQGPPSEARGFRAVSASAFCVKLTWLPPIFGSSEGLHYSLSYRLSPLSSSTLLEDSETAEWWALNRRLQTSSSPDNRRLSNVRRSALTTIDPIQETEFEVIGLRSFSLYHFTLIPVNAFGRGKPVHVQEYTEPTSVPLNLTAEIVTPSSIRIRWDSPIRNREGKRHYVVYKASKPIPIEQWERVDVGEAKQFSADQLDPNTKYSFSVSAQHNSGLAVFSKCLFCETKS